ncbi:hypothetical protein ABH922_001616 [Rhodococcus sp. 27YEA15]
MRCMSDAATSATARSSRRRAAHIRPRPKVAQAYSADGQGNDGQGRLASANLPQRTLVSVCETVRDNRGLSEPFPPTRVPSQWEEITTADSSHSTRYVQRFRTMASEGKDIVGEARMIDAMLGRGGRVLDAGCGPGRIGGYLHDAGHHVVGVDVDPVLIAAAEEDHSGPTWLVGDLAELDLPARGVAADFDVVVSAGNVMAFVAPSTRRTVPAGFVRHLAPRGRVVIGFRSRT